MATKKIIKKIVEKSAPVIAKPVNNLKMPGRNRASIKVVGVGGGGGNAISRMKDGFVRGVEFIAVNTDMQDLDYCNVHRRICIGKSVTRGLGTGMNPELGQKSAEENRQEIAEALSGADLVFLTAGLGGGTGSGATAVVAEIAKDIGALTVAVVTKPFSFEGGQRARIAMEALEKLKEKVDTYIVIPNDKIFQIIGSDTSINKAFEAIDNVLRGAVQGIAELIAMPGLINVDYADVKAIMKGAGSALVGVGMAAGKDRGISAVKNIVDFPLVDVSIRGAKGVLFGISGGRDMKMAEVNDIAKMIMEHADPSARAIFGAYYDRKVPKGKIKVTLIATSFGEGPVEKIQTTEMRASSLFIGAAEKSEPRLEPKEEMMVMEEESIKQELNVPKTEDNWKEKESPLANSNKKKRSSEIWDVPAFLRRKKK